MAVTLRNDYTWLNSCWQGSSGGANYYTNLYGFYSRTEEQEERNVSTVGVCVGISCDQTHTGYTLWGDWVGTLNGLFAGCSYRVNGKAGGSLWLVVYENSWEMAHDDNGNFSGWMGATGCDGPASNSVASTIESIEVTVPPIDRTVTLNTLTATNPTTNSATVSWAANKKCNKVEYKVNSGSWVTASTSEASSGTFTAGGLKEGTSNSIEVRVTRKASGRTDSSTVSVTTKSSNNICMKVGGSWKKGKAYIKINGSWKEATPYVKVNGSWKKTTG